MKYPRLFAYSQYILPHHLISRCVGWLASCRIGWLKNSLIQLFIRRFKVDMTEAAAESAEDYIDFNEFFTRPLKPGMRPLAVEANQLACPADGCISEMGELTHGRVLQAKGIDYSLTTLLGGDVEKARPFMGGQFMTIYLSPRDYHRVHMPLPGRLLESVYIPGRLFSVNQATANHVPGLFARNERLVAFFDTPAGPMAMILVGAMIVAGIETVWQGEVTPPKRQQRHWDFTDPRPVQLDKGDEMGRFKLGSTVILVFGPEAVRWQEGLAAGSPLRMGQGLGQLITAE